MKLYNSYTRRQELFDPIGGDREGRKIKIYACGITPYDRPHIGHAATAIRCSVLRRYLQYQGYSLNFVQNITDIDDKIINRAKQWGQEPREIAERFTREYHEEMELLGVPRPEAEPCVSEHITTIVSYIERLLELGHAYRTVNGDIYFNVESSEKYGCLSGQVTGELKSDTRLLAIDNEVRKSKRNSLDFVLWKRSDDPVGTFLTLLGRGRPGWHTECCAMSNALLGDTIDIHCGGLDLLFPHHENELAQAECHNGVQFSRFWFHLGLILVDGMKMSKSVGNVMPICHARNRWGTPLFIYGILTNHYRSPINLRDRLFEERINQLLDIYWFCDKIDHLASSNCDEFIEEIELAPELGDHEVSYPHLQLRECFRISMDSDLNTPRALVAVEIGVKKGIELLKKPEQNLAPLTALSREIKTILDVLLLRPPNYSFNRLFDDIGNFIASKSSEEKRNFRRISLTELNSLLDERDSLRSENRFERSDQIRKELANSAISCIDGSVRRWRISQN